MVNDNPISTHTINSQQRINPRLNGIEVTGQGWYAGLIGEEDRFELLIQDSRGELDLLERQSIIVDEIIPKIQSEFERRIQLFKDNILGDVSDDTIDTIEELIDCLLEAFQVNKPTTRNRNRMLKPIRQSTFSILD